MYCHGDLFFEQSAKRFLPQTKQQAHKPGQAAAHGIFWRNGTKFDRHATLTWSSQTIREDGSIAMA